MKIIIILTILFAPFCAFTQTNDSESELVETAFHSGAQTVGLIMVTRKDWAADKSYKEISDAALRIFKDREADIPMGVAFDRECPHPYSSPMCQTNANFIIITGFSTTNIVSTNGVEIVQTNWIGCPITGDLHSFQLVHLVDGWHPEYEIGLKPDGTVIWRSTH